jgi:hypothetical protein
MTTNMMVMPDVDERICHRPEDWEFHGEHLGQCKAPRCTVFLRNDRVETTRNLFGEQNDTAKKKKFARSPARSAWFNLEGINDS